MLSLASSGLLLVPGPWIPSAEARERSSWFWEWSDGSTSRDRTLNEARYGVWSRLPRIAVASAPAAAGRTVRLQVQQSGGWVTEDTVRTDLDGRAELTINPYCHHGDWCSGTAEYRIVADGDQATLRVTFTPTRTSP